MLLSCGHDKASPELQSLAHCSKSFVAAAGPCAALLRLRLCCRVCCCWAGAACKPCEAIKSRNHGRLQICKQTHTPCQPVCRSCGLQDAGISGEGCRAAKLTRQPLSATSVGCWHSASSPMASANADRAASLAPASLAAAASLSSAAASCLRMAAASDAVVAAGLPAKDPPAHTGAAS